MISYDTYQNKIKRIAAVKNFIVRFRALFITLLAVIIALIAAFIFTKGMITQDIVLPDKIVYGDNYANSIQAPKALFSDARYQFKRVKEESSAKSNVRYAAKVSDGQGDEYDWTYELPTLAGKYLVRTVTNKTFGKSYGNPKEFEIEALAVEFIIESDSVVYGEMPANYDLKLINGDAIIANDTVISYANPELDKTSITGATFTILNKYGEDVTYCYNISIPEKEVSILPQNVTLTPDSLNVEYNGIGTDYNAIAENTVYHLKGGDARIKTVISDSAGNEVSGIPVNAGVYTVSIIPDGTTVYNGEANVLKHYNIKYSTATLTITRRPITVTTASANKEYDGTALVNTDYTENGLIDNLHKISLSSAPVTAIDAGIYENAFTCTITDAQGTDVTDNYKFDYVNGTLEITPRTIKVTSGNYTKTYDGNADFALDYTSYTVEKDGKDALVAGHTESAVFPVSHAAAGTYDNIIYINIGDVNGRDVSSNYSIQYVYGSLEILKREISVTSSGGSWVYDGIAHTNIEIQKIILTNGDGEPLANGEEIAVAQSTRVTFYTENAVENVIVCRISKNGYDTTSNYVITYINGSLNIEKRSIILTTPSASRPYDGTALRGIDIFLMQPDNLAYNDRLQYSVENYSFITDCGKVENKTAFIITNNNDDRTENYEITYVYGELEVTGREIVIYTPTIEKFYDGTPLSGDSAAPATDNIVGGQICVPYDTVSLINAGAITNTTLYKICSDADATNETTENYVITYVYGTLTVNKRTIYVETATRSKEYDGTSFSCAEWQILPGDNLVDLSGYGLLENHTLKTDETVQPAFVTNVYEGEVPNAVYYEVYCGEDNVSENYNLLYSFGKISVTPRNVKITTGSKEWVYNAESFSYPSATAAHVSFDGTEYVQDGLPTFVLDHDMAVRFIFAAMNAGNYDNACEYEILSTEGYTVTANYNLIMDYGTLVIKPRPIIITTHDGSSVYNDEPFSYISADPEEYDEEGQRGLIAGHEIVHDVSAKTAFVTFVTEGKVENELHYLIYSGEQTTENDVTANYAISYDYGSIWVTRRAITITTATSSKEFYGEKYFDVDYTVTDGTLAVNHVLKDTYHSEVTFVTDGEVLNEVTYSVLKGDTDLTDNYDIDYVYGYISITVRYVQITTNTASWTYDGMVHSDAGYTDNGHLINVTVDADGNFVSYEFDGTAGLVLGHGLVALSRTEVKDFTETPVANNVAYVVENDSIDKNYRLLIIAGELSVSRRPVVITTATKEKVYDGDPFSYTGDWLAEGGEVDGVKLEWGLVDGHTLKVTGNITEITDVLWQDGEVIGVKNEVGYGVFSGNDEVTANYEISYVYGTLTRTPRPIIISTGSDKKVYDGYALTCATFTWDNSNADNTRGLLSGKNHLINLDTDKGTASITYITVGNDNELIDSTDNVRYYKIFAGSDEVTANYAITYFYGTLKIEKRSLTVTTATLSWDYDGLYHYGTEEHNTPNGKAVFDNLVQSEFAQAINPTEIIDYSSDTVYNTTEYKFYTDSTCATETTYCYDINYINGTLTINRIALDVTTVTATKVYDGDPLRGDDESYASPLLSGIIAGETYKSYDVAHLTDCGSVKNSTQYRIFALRGGIETETTDNYVIHYTEGTLTVTQREITVTTKTAVHEYDGVEFTYTAEWEDSGALKLVKDHTLEVVEVIGKITDAGSVENKVVYKVVDGSGNDGVNKNYVIKYVYGTLTVTPRNIRITTASHSWVYDANEHFDDGYEKVVHIDKDGAEDGAFALVGSHSLIPVDGTATVVLNYTPVKADNEVEFIVVDDTVTANYNITYSYGKLEIIRRPVTITTATRDREYDGTPFSWTQDFVVEKFDLENNSGIVFGHTALLDKNADVTEVTYVHEGEVDNVLQFVIEDNSGEDLTYNYEINYIYGKLSITPHAITVTNPTLEKVYDGGYLYGDDTSIFDGKLLNSDVCAPDTVAKIIDAGEIKNNTTYTILNSSGVDVTDSYTINYTDGATLTVTVRKATIYSATLEKVYDGTPLYGEESLNTVVTIINATGKSGFVGNDYITPDVKNTTGIINVAVGVENATKFFVFVNRDGNEVDITDNYDIEYVCGTLTVTVREITIATATDTKEFDGTPLTNTVDAKVTSGSIAEGQYLYVKAGSLVSSVTYVTEGSVDNVIEYSVYGEDGDVSENYSITYWNMYEGKYYGTLSVTPRRISLVTNSNSWEYDGVVHKDSGYNSLSLLSGSGDALVSGHSLVAVSDTEIINAGSIENAVVYIVVDEDVNKNYEINCSYGMLTVTPRSLTIILNTVDGFVYGEKFADYPLEDGKAYTYADGSKQTVDGEVLTITVKYQQSGVDIETPVNAGRYDVVLNAYSIEGGIEDNYILTVVGTSFEISKRAITISLVDTEDGGKLYDGYEYNFDALYGYEISSGTLADGDSLSVAVRYMLNGNYINSAPVNAGSYTIVYDGANCTVNGSTELAENYDVTCLMTSLQYVITPRALTFDIKDLQHAYVGELNYEFANEDAMTFDETQLAETDVLSNVTATTMRDGSVFAAIDVGEYDYVVNSFTVLNKSDGSNVTQNYYLDANQRIAKFTVTPRQIIIKTSFDGDTYSSREYTGDIIDLKGIYNAPYGPYTSEPVAADTVEWGIYAGDYDKLNAVFSFTKNGAVAELIDLGRYEVFVTIENKSGYDALKNYEIVSSVYGEFEITKRQVNVIPVISAENPEYNGEKIDNGWLGYITAHNFSEAEGFLEDTDKQDYSAVYSLYKVGDDATDVIDDILQAGNYYIKVSLTFIGSGEEKYLINDSFSSDIFTVAKRKIYANTADDLNAYVYNNTAVDYPEEYTTYSNDGNWTADSGFVNGDEAYAVPVYTYVKGDEEYSNATDAGEYTIKISGFNGFNGGVSIADNYEVCDMSEISDCPFSYGTLTIKPAILVVVPTAYSQPYDGTQNKLSLSSDCYEIKYVEGKADCTLFEAGAVLTFTASGSVDITKTFITMVSFTEVAITADGKDVTANYDIVFTYSKLKETCPDMVSALTPDKFLAQLSFIQRKVYISQFAPPEEYRVIEYGTNVRITLEDNSVPEENILNLGDGFLAGHKPVVNLAMAIAVEIGEGVIKNWIILCKVFDGDTDVSMGYSITIVNTDENDESKYSDTYITVVSRKITIGVNFAPSAFNEGDVLDADCYNIPTGSMVFGDKLEIRVENGKYVANIQAPGGGDKNSYYEVTFNYPGMEKEAENASRI